MSERRVRWAMGHPQRTNASGDPPSGTPGKFHAFMLTDDEVCRANLDVMEGVSPLCENKRWTGAVGPTFMAPIESECCKKCLAKAVGLG